MFRNLYLFFVGSILFPFFMHAQVKPLLSPEDTLTVVPYYADVDGDGYGDPAVIVFSSTGAPEGYVANNTDCAPSNPNIYSLGTFYVDADNDGFYDGNPFPTVVCYGSTTPSGYTEQIFGSDCDDTRFEVNSNHVEVLGNGIDDNCDGNIDEIGPYTTLMPVFCGNVLQRLSTPIYATALPGATGYRFQVTLGASVTTFDSDVNFFSLQDLPVTVAYLTTYNVRISVRTNGFWRAYAPWCTVSTPRAPIITHILTQQCGMNMSNMANTIYCYQNTSATLYRFELSDDIHPPRVFDSAVNRFNMQSFTGGGEFGTTYTIRVALFINGVWEDFGPSCTLTTPPLPPYSWVIDSQCGITISNTWTTIYTGQIPEAEAYRFKVVNGSSTRFYDTLNSRFNLHNLAGAPPAPNTTYSISVAILYHGAYLDFGPVCTITTASVITRQASSASASFDARVFPNPFTDSFKLEIQATEENAATIKVYDLFGRLVESKEITYAESGTIDLGSRFVSGVYTVVINRGEQVKTLRVVKR